MDPDYDALEALAAELEGSEQWPPPREARVRHAIRLWKAMYSADASFLKDYCGWQRKFGYVCDSLARRISDAMADLLFGADPKVAAAGQGAKIKDEATGETQVVEVADQELLIDLVEENDLSSELQEAAATCSSEGEVWWRWMIDEDQAFVPVLEFHSRLQCIPLFEGKVPIAAAFVSELKAYKRENSESEVVWRLIEYQARGVIQNVLYRGTRDKLGIEEPLDALAETADLYETDENGIWEHGLPEMLCGRVPNGFGGQFGHYCGRSDYEPVKDMLFALNEATSIAADNVNLTARKRVVIPDTYLDKRGRPPLDDDVIISSEAHRDPDKPAAGFQQIEWDFDAEALIAYTRDLINKIATRVGLTASYVDANAGEEGLASSGTALRLRMLPASNTARGKARWWDDAGPKILAVGAQLDALPVEEGGFAHSWEAPEELPSFERGDPFPRDKVEDATMVVQLQATKILSNQTSLEILFPEWNDDRVQEELDRLAAESAAAIEQQQEMFGAPGGFQPPPEVPIEDQSTAETG